MSQHGLRALLKAYDQDCAQQKKMVLATVVQTWGSTYRKTGARMLIHDDNRVTGIVGGGCFDTDLAEKAKTVFDTLQPTTVTYDMRSPDEAIWGLGLGCNGAVRLFLQAVGQDVTDNPLPLIQRLISHSEGGLLATQLETSELHKAGACWIQSAEEKTTSKLVFIDKISAPFNLGIYGAGADTIPLIELAARLDWDIHLSDYRSGMLIQSRFPLVSSLSVFNNTLPASFKRCDAVIVMSHNLDADRRFLAALSNSHTPYIGVLGPSHRKEQLLKQLGDKANTLHQRLYGPLGLDLGGELPEEIALAVLSEIQALRYQRSALALTGSGLK